MAMNFKQYLAEGPSNIKVKPTADKLDAKKALEYLKENVPIAMKCIAEGNMLWRGTSMKGSFVLVDSSKSLRVSKDTNNVYQLMMDTSAALSDYPSRSRSLICSTDWFTAEQYGTAYAVFPQVGTKVACSKTEDFIEQTIKAPPLVISSGIEDFSKNLFKIIKRCAKKAMPGGKKVHTVEELKRAFEAAVQDESFARTWAQESSFWQEVKSEEVKRFFERHRGHEFQAMCDLIMTPQSLRLSLLTVDEGFPRALKKHQDEECWFSGRCFMVSKKTLVGVVRQMLKEKLKVNEKLLHYLGADDDDSI